MRAKYTHRTNLRFMLCVFRDCIEPDATARRRTWREPRILGALLRGSPLRRAVTSEIPHQNDAAFLRCRWLFRILFAFRPLSLRESCHQEKMCAAHPSLMTSGFPCCVSADKPHVFTGNGYGKPMRGRPLIWPGYGRMLVTASPKLALAGQGTQEKMKG